MFRPPWSPAPCARGDRQLNAPVQTERGACTHKNTPRVFEGHERWRRAHETVDGVADGDDDAVVRREERRAQRLHMNLGILQMVPLQVGRDGTTAGLADVDEERIAPRFSACPHARWRPLERSSPAATAARRDDEARKGNSAPESKWHQQCRTTRTPSLKTGAAHMSSSSRRSRSGSTNSD